MPSAVITAARDLTPVTALVSGCRGSLWPTIPPQRPRAHGCLVALWLPSDCRPSIRCHTCGSRQSRSLVAPDSGAGGAEQPRVASRLHRCQGRGRFVPDAPCDAPRWAAWTAHPVLDGEHQEPGGI